MLTALQSTTHHKIPVDNIVIYVPTLGTCEWSRSKLCSLGFVEVQSLHPSGVLADSMHALQLVLKEGVEPLLSFLLQKCSMLTS